MFSNTDIGIDLGTANLLVYTKDLGIVFNEPTVVAMQNTTKQVIAIGNEAKEMIGKTPKSISIFRPLKNGVIADYDITSQLLSKVMKTVSKELGIIIRKPDVVVCTPFGATSVEKRAIIDAVKSSGAKNAHLIEEPVAAAVGAELPVEEPIGNVIIDIGGGTTEVAIISYGGVVACHTVRIGGVLLDDQIIQHVRKNYNMLIGEQTAEQIKMEIGYALVDHPEITKEVRGRDLITGLPKTIFLSSFEIQNALKESLLQILATIRLTLENSPAELSGDIVDRGVVLSGGGALLKGMQEWLSKEIVVPVHLVPYPLESVAIGTGLSLKFIKQLQKSSSK